MGIGEEQKILTDVWQLNSDIADTLPTLRESASHTSKRCSHPSDLDLRVATVGQQWQVSGIMILPYADAGVPGGWWEANEVVTLTTVCYMPVGKTIMSGVLGDKYGKTYVLYNQNEPITHENEYNYFGWWRTVRRVRLIYPSAIT